MTTDPRFFPRRASMPEPNCLGIDGPPEPQRYHPRADRVASVILACLISIALAVVLVIGWAR